MASLLLCAACGPVTSLPPLSKDDIEAERRHQQIAQIKSYYSELRRVDNVAFRIRTANRADCKNWVSAQIGLYAATPQSLPHRYRSYSSEALTLTRLRPTAIAVAATSPAAQAGIAVGDEVIALNGTLIPLTDTPSWVNDWLTANGEKPVQVNVRRDSVDRTVAVTPVMGCAIPINYVTADEVNAFTDGKKIVISSAIVAVARTDAQLALVIGHELAHANLGHNKRRLFNTLLGAAGGVMVDAGFLVGGISTGGVFTRQLERAGAMAYSVGFEREADYVGSYYAARAGFDLAGTEEIWRAIGEAHPDSIRFAKTHPSTPERFIQMQKVAEEIADKQLRHLPLVPELKTTHADTQPRAEPGERVQ